MSWKQNQQSVTRNESCVATHSQAQQAALTNVEVSAYNNSYKSANCINEEEESLNHKSLEKSEVTTNIVENDKNFESNVVNNVAQENKNDNIKLTDQLLQINIPELYNSPIEKFSLDFFEESSPKMAHDSQKRRDSESLLSFRDCKKNQTHNFTMKHSIDDVQDVEKASNIPTKKSRTSNEINTASSICVNAITRAFSFENDTKPRVSRSPSLFDDSLNLDTQILNVLEQNIDSLHFTEFEETVLSQNKLATENKEKTKLQTTKNINTEAQTEKNIKDKHINKTPLNFTNSQAKHSILSWKEDSWNESKKITEKLNQICDKNTKEENEKVSVKCNIRNVKNTNIGEIVESPGTSISTPEMRRKCPAVFEKSANTSDNLRKISQKHKFKDRCAEKSPVTNVIAFSNRRASFDSNKSDSDDIIIASQNMDSPAASIRIRSRLDSEKKRKMYTQKVPNRVLDEATNYTSPVSETIHIKKYKFKPKLKEILPRNVLTSKDCSTDSVISNSDEGTPIKSEKLLQKSKISLKQVQKDSETCLQTNTMSNISETTNWNTLNIVKVGSDRGTFNLFKREVMQKRCIALALNCEMYNNDGNNIGSKIVSSTNSERKKRSKKVENYVYADKKLCGAAISWESNIAYYITFSNEQGI